MFGKLLGQIIAAPLKVVKEVVETVAEEITE